MRRSTVFWASGTKGKSVRADGKGKTLARGFWYNVPFISLGVVLAGPFATKVRALESLVEALQQ